MSNIVKITLKISYIFKIPKFSGKNKAKIAKIQTNQPKMTQEFRLKMTQNTWQLTENESKWPETDLKMAKMDLKLPNLT